MPAYQETKPLSTDKLSDSQADIANNFTAIKALVDVNHEDFNSGASPEGKHTKVDVTNSATHPAVAATDVLLYNYVNAMTTLQELYVKRTGALATAGIPFTAKGGTTSGWTYLPSGLLLKWGTDTKSGVATVTFPAGATIPAFTAIYAVLVNHINTNANPNSFVTLQAQTTTTFTVACTQRTTTTSINNVPIYYFAIGI